MALNISHREHFLTQRFNWTTKSTAAVTNSTLKAWFFSSVLWAKEGGSFFRKHLMRRCMDIPSVLFSFLEAAIKCQSTATEPEIKQPMSAHLKTHLAVHGGGRTMIERWIIGKRMLDFKFTVMREPDLQRITFLGFKIFKIFQNFKTTFGYYLSNFCVLVSFQANVLFLYQRIKV